MLFSLGLSHINDGGRSYTPLQVVPAETCATILTGRAEGYAKPSMHGKSARHCRVGMGVAFVAETNRLEVAEGSSR
jgi:hypothetical protein